MIEIPRSSQYNQNRNKANHNFDFCCVCGKAIENPKHWLHTSQGGYAITEQEATTLPDNDDSGAYPIGNNCLKSHPELKPYAQ